MSHIFFNLYLGNVQDASHMLDADLVVNCTHEHPFFATFAKHIRVPINDTPNDQRKLYEIIMNTDIFPQMTEALLQNKKILVHCHAGVSRSASLLACFIMYYCKYVHLQAYDLQSVIAFIKNRRPIVFHDGFNFRETMEHYDRAG